MVEQMNRIPRHLRPIGIRATALAGLLAACSALAFPGDLDPTFGTGGIVETPREGGLTLPGDIASTITATSSWSDWQGIS